MARPHVRRGRGMSVIFLVLPLALAIVLVAVVAFVWAARRGQYDDLDTPAVRILFEDDTRRR
jgi:cbb3-type cytochrome oxidase maturation protein